MKTHGADGKEMCCGCGACADRCDAGAISMEQDEEGFFYPQIDRAKCTGCGWCGQICPMKKYQAGKGGRRCSDGQKREQDHSFGVQAELPNRYFGAQAKNPQIRYDSSSGGIFPLLAQSVLERQGVVYGAGYDEQMRVVHKEAHSLGELEALKRTKYVQSSLEGIYERIERQLKEGKQVLFCGTPCQAEALRLFLNKPYETLLLVDLVCYGVPSPGVWRDYVQYLEHEHGGAMRDFSFRDKRNKDNGHMRSFFIDSAEYVDSLFSDLYCKLYFGNYILRPSCHACPFCTTVRNSDFTIGDFWGMERIRPDMDDGMGTSLVIAHTEKARQTWDGIKAHTAWFACEKEQIIQPRLQSPAGAARGRRLFMAAYKALPFAFLLKLFIWAGKCKFGAALARRKVK